MRCGGHTFFAPIAIGLFAAVLICGSPARAHAQSADPFEADSSEWKSFDLYKEEEKNRLFSTMTGNIEADSKAAAEAEAKDDTDAEKSKSVSIKKPASDAEKDSPIITPPSLDSSAMAAPEKPLEPPVMPGVNNSSDTHAVSTDDDAKPAARIVNVDSQPNLQLPKQNWLDAVRAAKLNGMEDHTALHIRMSFLPGFEVPQKQNAAAPKMTIAAAPPPIKKEVPPKSPADAAACAAIDAYKKKQLEAIQSDRETLAALQGAIKKLGLEQKLDFMSGAGSVSTTADKSALMDMPVTTPSASTPVGKPN